MAIPRTALGKLNRSATQLMQEALTKSLQSAGLQMKAGRQKRHTRGEHAT